MPDPIPSSAPVVAVTRSALPGQGLARLAAGASIVKWGSARPPDRLDLMDLVARADGLLCLGLDKIDREIISAGPRLRVVSTVSVGFDNLDMSALADHRIPASNTPGVLTETTADLAWALILAASRRVVEADRFVRAHQWREPGFELMLGHDVHGATLGIVGYGAIGRAVARRSTGFGMNVVHFDVAPSTPDGISKWVPLDELLTEADIVSIHVTITPKTRHLIGERELRLMKPTAVLVNAARGQVIEQEALFRALRDGWIFAAGLDTTEVEPVPDDDPILTLPNCIVLPHIGSATEATRARMVDTAVDNILAGLSGAPLPNCINPEVYSRR